MTQRRSSTRPRPAARWRIGALFAVLAVLPSACGLVDAARETNAAELVGLAIDAPCVIERNEVGDLGGAFLRQTAGEDRFELFHVRGQARRSGLPRRITFDDTAIRRLSDAGDGTVTGGRRSVATPIEALQIDAAQAYTLDYTAGGIPFSGPLTLGTIPSPAAFPTAGQAVFAGTAEMTATLADGEGGVSTLRLSGPATLSVGYGSGQSLLTVREIAAEGGAAPFATLQWGPLGFCGARVVSTGAGSFRLTNAEGARVRPFAAPPGAEALTPTRARLDSTLYTLPDAGQTGAPVGAGGVFVVQGDGGVLRGVFTVGGSG